MRLTGALLACGVLAACSPKGPSKAPYVADAKAEAELMAADKAFAEDSFDHGAEAWAQAFAEDGVELASGEPVVKGKAAVRALMAPMLSDPTNRLRWEPEHASVSASGDLGYTLGHAMLSKVGPNGSEVVIAKLKYLTVWKRQADGHWKVAADVGANDPL